MERFVALLRGINVGGHRQVPMAKLRALAEEAGLEAVRTYVASGNLIFATAEPQKGLEDKLEKAIEAAIGFGVDVLVRSRKQWGAYVRANPLADLAESQPNYLMLTLGKRPAKDADVEALRAKASGDERVERADDAIWVWYANGAGRSKIGTGAKTTEVWTTRNWRTVLAIQEMLDSA